MGPFPNTQINDNGTVRFQKGIINDATNIRRVFGRDAILNIKHVAEWEHICQRKQLRINHNNMRENMQRNNHQYKVGDKILVKRKKNSKHIL